MSQLGNIAAHPSWSMPKTELQWRERLERFNTIGVAS